MKSFFKIQPINLSALALTLCLTFCSNSVFGKIEIGTIVNATSNGQCDGSIEIIADGSAGPFNIKLTGNNAVVEIIGVNGTYVFESLCPGEYDIQVDNQFGCQTNLTGVVEECLEISIITPICICSGGFGTAQLTFAGGSGDYSYYWSGPNNFTALGEDPQFPAAGVYDVIVIDNTSQCEVTAQVDIETCDFTANNFDITVNHSCDGSNTGSIAVEIPLGVGAAPYLFKWSKMNGSQQVPLSEYSSPDGTATLADLGPGEYCFQVISMNGCETGNCGIVIEEYAPPVIDAVITPETTPGANNASIQLTPIGGVGPIKYKWSNNATGPVLSNVPAGDYSVTVTYGNYKCTEVYDYTIHTCADLLANVNPTTVVYAETPTTPATIDLTITSLLDYYFAISWTATGHPSYHETTEDITPPWDGQYCYTISNATCGYTDFDCDDICDFSIFFETFPNPPSVQCDGTQLTAITSEILSPVTYLWSTGESAASIIALYGHEYCITITNGSGCNSKACFTPTVAPITLTFSTTNATFGNSDGSATVIPQGGVMPYDYLWGNGGTGGTINNVLPGEYCVTVTDQCGTTMIDCVTVQCEFGTSILSASITPVNCTTGTRGSIDLSLTLLLNQPQYLWSNGITTQDLNQVSAGQYCVTVTEASGCTATGCFVVPGGTGTFAIDFSVDGGCLGGNNGTITALPGGGLFPFAYNWSAFTSSTFNGVPFSANTQTITDLEVGWYYVTVTDKIGCSATDWTFLYQPPPFTVIATATPNPVCSGDVASGDVEITGGTPTPPLTYLWVNYNVFPNIEINTTSPHVDGLIPGTWGVSVTDGEGCIWPTWVRIKRSEEIIPNIIVCDATSPNGNGPPYLPEGTIHVHSVSGGTPPYNFQWCCGGNTQFWGGIGSYQYAPIGNYSLTITDINGCTFEDNYEIEFIEEWQDVHITATVTNANCICCETGGAIHLSIENLTVLPFYLLHYEDSPIGVIPVETIGPFNSTELDFTNLKVGIRHFYTLALSGDNDGDGRPDCSTTIFFDPIVIEAANAIVIDIENISSVPALIDISVSGGQSPYTYLWSNGATTQDISNMPGGIYTVTVTDNTGCTETRTFEICTDPPPITGYSLPQNCPTGCIVPCRSGLQVGKIFGPNFLGGTPPFSYQWTGPDNFTATTKDISGLDKEGLYCLTATDACYMTFEYCRELLCDCTLNVSVSGDDCAQDDPGEFIVNGIGPYKEHEYIIQWFDGEIVNVWVDEDGELSVISGGVLEKTIDEPFGGVLCITVSSVSMPSCQAVICRQYYGHDQCVYRFTSFNNGNDNMDLEEYLEENYSFYSDFVINCYSDNPCGQGGGGGPESMTFTPYSMINPCNAGGLLECDECSYNELWVDVPENSVGIPIEMGGNCYCLWPSTLFVNDYDFIEALYNGNSSSVNGNNEILEEIWSLGVVAEYDCNGPTLPPGGGGGGDNPLEDECIDLACDECPEGCIIEPDEDPESCQFIVYCMNGNSEEVVECPSPGTTRSICKEKIYYVFGETCQYKIYEQCTINPCQKEELFVCDGGSCLEDLETYGLEDLVDCGESYPFNECDCYDLAESEIPDCIACQSSGGFQNGGEEEKANKGDNSSKTLFNNRQTINVAAQPNPFSDGLTISVFSMSDVEGSIRVLDIYGRTSWMIERKIVQGYTSVIWKPSIEMPSGIYQIFVTTSEGAVAVTKVIYDAP